LSFGPGVHQTDVGGNIVGVNCPKTECSKLSWACLTCRISWKESSNTNRHKRSQGHVSITRERDEACERDEAYEARLAETHIEDFDCVDGGGGDFTEWNEDNHMSLPPSTSGEGDWLTSIPGKVGEAATTLQAIKEFGSFHPD